MTQVISSTDITKTRSLKQWKFYKKWTNILFGISIGGFLLLRLFMIAYSVFFSGIFSTTSWKNLVFNDFNSLELTGGWVVKIVQSQDSSVRVAFPADLDESLLSSNFDSKRLALSWKDKASFLRAEITLPELKNLKTNGSINVILEGFEQDEMSLELTSIKLGSEAFLSRKIEVKSSKIEKLLLKIQGEIFFDSLKSTVNYANLMMAGRAFVDLKIQEKGTVEGVVDQRSSLSISGLTDLKSVHLKLMGPTVLNLRPFHRPEN